jgi:hypothetical protein
METRISWVLVHLDVDTLAVRSKRDQLERVVNAPDHEDAIARRRDRPIVAERTNGIGAVRGERPDENLGSLSNGRALRRQCENGPHGREGPIRSHQERDDGDQGKQGVRREPTTAHGRCLLMVRRPR